MVSYDANAYSEMLGNIVAEAVNAGACMSQCTGCKCSCKCACRNRDDDSFGWEEL